MATLWMDQVVGVFLVYPDRGDQKAHTSVKTCQGFGEAFDAIREIAKNQPTWEAIFVVPEHMIDKVLDGADYDGRSPRLGDER